MDGFVLPGDTERLPANFIKHLPKKTDPRILYKSEWRIVMNLTKKVVEVRDELVMMVQTGCDNKLPVFQFFGKRPYFDPEKLPKQFFESFVPWLTDSTRPFGRRRSSRRQNAGPTAEQRSLTPTAELFSLIRSAAALFASDLEMGSELVVTGNGGRSTGGAEPRGTGCDQSTLAVSMARLKPSRAQYSSLSKG